MSSGTENRGDWRDDALCAQVDPEIFFPLAGTPGREAYAVCRRCDVSKQCLDYAVRHGITDGIWGGVNPRGRRTHKPIVDPNFCPNGHPRTPENRGSAGRCLPCQRITARKKNLRKLRTEYDRDTG